MLDIAGWVVAGLFVVFCSMMLWQYIMVKKLPFWENFLMTILKREAQHRALAFGGEPMQFVGVVFLIAATFVCVIVANLPAPEYIPVQGKVLAIVVSFAFLILGSFIALWKSLKEFSKALSWAIQTNRYRSVIGLVTNIRPADSHFSVSCYHVTVRIPETVEKKAEDVEFFVRPEALGYGMSLPFFGEVIVLFDGDCSRTAEFIARP